MDIVLNCYIVYFVYMFVFVTLSILYPIGFLFHQPIT